jgi:phosphoribosylanthranilate isomerase
MAAHVRIKICGITHPDDLDDAVAAGADAVGLNFHPPSPRYVTLEQAAALLGRLPPFVEPVGVFVRHVLSALRQRLEPLGRIRVVQVHGGPPEVVTAAPLVHIPAFQVRDARDLEAINAYLEECKAANAMPGAILVDGYAPGLVGGTGHAAPWDLLAEFRPGVPLILAGGLTPDNVAEAVRRVRPFAVDVAGGVESKPGRKDRGKVRAFIQAALEQSRDERSP